MEQKKKRELNLTEGSPFKLIIAFCIPMILGNMFQQLYNFVDTMIVGHFLGVEALAGVGATVINVFLDCSFIAGLGWGVFGAAFATVCSQLISGILCLILVIPKIGFIGACIASPLAWILADMFLFPAYFHVMKKLEVMMASRKIAH